MTSGERQGFGSGGISTNFGASKTPIYDETTAKALRLAHRRKWTMIGSLVLLAAIAIGVIVFNNISSSRAKESAKEFLAIEADFVAATQKFQETLQANPQTAAEARPDYTAVAQRFHDFANRNVDKPLGWQAALRASAIYLDTGKTKEARELLEQVEKRTLKSSLIQVKVRRALAGIYADAKEYDKALAELDFAEKLPDNPGLSEIKLFKGQVLYLAGKKEDAARVLKEIAGDPTALLDPNAKAASSEAAMWIGYWGL